MTTRRRIVWLLSMGGFLIVTSGCASSNWRNIEDEMEREGTGLHDVSGQKVKGFQLQGSEPSKYKGWARIVDQDSLSLWTMDGVEKVRGPEFALATVDNLEVVQVSTEKSLQLGVVIVGLLIAWVVHGTSNW